MILFFFFQNFQINKNFNANIKKIILVVAVAVGFDVLMDDEKEVENMVVENQRVDACLVHDHVDLMIIHSIDQCY